MRRYVIFICCLTIAIACAAIGIIQLCPTAEGKVKMHERVLLQFKARELPNRLELSYRITNETDRPIYTTDLGIIVKPGGTSVVGFEPRVSWEAPATILLSTALQPLDPTVTRLVPLKVYARRLRPTESIENKVQLSLPLRLTGVMPTDKEERIVCSRVRLEISAIADSDALTAKEQTVGNQPMWLLSAAAWHQHWIVTAEQEALSIPMLVNK